MCEEEERNKSGKKQEQSTSTAAAATAKKERKKKFMLLLVSCLEFLAAATATISPSCFFFFFPNYCCDAYRLNSHGGHVLWAAAEGTELDYSTSMEIAVIRQRASSLPFSSPTLLITLRQNDFFSLSLSSCMLWASCFQFYSRYLDAGCFLFWCHYIAVLTHSIVGRR